MIERKPLPMHGRADVVWTCPIKVNKDGLIKPAELRDALNKLHNAAVEAHHYGFAAAPMVSVELRPRSEDKPLAIIARFIGRAHLANKLAEKDPGFKQEA